MLLYIVGREQPFLYESLRQEFAEDPGIQVILDGRIAERRARLEAGGQERRRRERRCPSQVVADLRSAGCVILEADGPPPHDSPSAAP